MSKEESPPKGFQAAAVVAVTATANAIDRIFGGAANEIGASLTDRMREWRFKNAVAVQERLKKICAEKNISPPEDPLPPRIAVPLIEGALGAEDDSMRDRWAALMATAMTPEKAKTVTRLLISILDELEPVHAKLLTHISTLSWGAERKLTVRGHTVPQIAEGLAMDFMATEAAILALERQTLVERVQPFAVDDFKPGALVRYRITLLGDDLLEACTHTKARK